MELLKSCSVSSSPASSAVHRLAAVVPEAVRAQADAVRTAALPAAVADRAALRINHLLLLLLLAGGLHGGGGGRCVRRGGQTLQSGLVH